MYFTTAYCVGSSEVIEDDIVPCTTVGEQSGCAELADGMFTVTWENGDTESIPLAEFKIVDHLNTLDPVSEFMMEPGK